MIYGWDISTSIIGMCEFDEDGKFSHADHLDLRKVDDFNEKAYLFRVFAGDNVDEFRQADSVHFVEDRLGNFAAGRSMMQVMMKLAAFNAVCSFILWDKFNERVTHIHPSSWKAVMKKDGLLIPKGTDKKKEITLDFVRRHVPEFPVDLNKKGNVQPWCFDMADAYCIGRAGYLRYAQGEKASGAPAEPR